MDQAGPSMSNDRFYEIRHAGRKGRGAFALKNIVAGTRILIDPPLFVIEKDEDDITIHDVASKMSTLSPAARKHFETLPIAANFVGSPTAVQHYGRFHLSKFRMHDAKSWGCFAHASRFNNSCLPNCAVSSTTIGAKQLYVTRSVSAGEELTFAYTQILQYMTTFERDCFLRPQFGGSPCICELCCLPPEQRSLSDMRRKLMRHLLFLVRDGRDLDGGAPMPITTSSFSPLPTFENDSEPAGYFTALAEEEGVGGVLVWSMYAKGTRDLINHFVNEGIMEIPESAMRTASLWMRRACHMKVVFRGNTDVFRKITDDVFDQLAKLVAALERSGGLFQAAEL